MSRRMDKLASSSVSTALVPHAYTPLGRPALQVSQLRNFWPEFRRTRIQRHNSTLQNDHPHTQSHLESHLTRPHVADKNTEVDSDGEIYRLGDAVMVRHTTPLPLVGLITQIWTMAEDVGVPRSGSQNDGQGVAEDDDQDDDAGFVPLWCKIRFLYWPSSLSTQTRTRMEGLVGTNEIFYTHRLPLSVGGSRRTARSLAAAATAAQDDSALGPSWLESDGFTVSEILGHAFIYGSSEDASIAASADTKALLHQGKVVTRHLYCAKAVDPMKELFWNIDYNAVAAKGRSGKGWDLVVKDEDVRGRALREWAETEKAKAKQTEELPELSEKERHKVPKKRKVIKKPANNPIKNRGRISSISVSSSATESSTSEDDPDKMELGSEDDFRVSDYSVTASDRRRGNGGNVSDVKGTRSNSETSDEDDSDASDKDDHASRRRRRRARFSTVANATATPHSRRIIDLRREARKKLMGRSQVASSAVCLPDSTSSLPVHFESVEKLAQMSPTDRAKRLLHVSTTPSRLPCRSKQADELLCLLEDSLDTGIGTCIYISGVPGTGKTATVRGVISQLQWSSVQGHVNPFDFLEINGMKVADAGQAYSMLWSVVGDRGSRGSAQFQRSPKAAMNLLSKYYATTSKATATGLGPVKAATIVLMDELDQLLTSRQDVMYNLFNWPSSRNSRLIVIAVANTMDLPERTMSAKVASRLGMTRITFTPYTDRELGEIVRSRLGLDARGKPVEHQEDEDGPARVKATRFNTDVAREQRLALHKAATVGCDKIFANDAITYAAKRVSNVSGDARRMLDICRRSIEFAEVRSVDGAGAAQPLVTIADVRSVLDVMVKASRPSHISRSLSLHAKILLVSLLALVKKTGLAEICLADLAYHHRALCRLHGVGDEDRQDGALGAEEFDGRTGALGDIGSLSLTLLLNQLASLGLVIPVGSGVGPGRAAPLARVLLSQSVREDEVRLSLEGDVDRRIRGML